MAIDLKPKFEIPVVDFSRYQNGSAKEKKECIAEIINAFTTSGFLYLSKSGLSPKTAYEWSQKYFALPLQDKLKYPNAHGAGNRGYSGFALETATKIKDEEASSAPKAAVPDLKESLEIGSDAGDRYPTKPWENKFPESLPGFGEAMGLFFSQCDTLHNELMSAIAEGLGLEQNFFRSHVTQGDHVLRLLHYPAVERSLLRNRDTIRSGAHTDFGTVTLLFQDGSGGLQVRTPDGTYKDVPPIEDAIVINAGDMLQFWTNDVIKSTKHRVASPPNELDKEDGLIPERFSIAFFAHPDHDTAISTISSCCTEANPSKYDSIKPGEWIINRLAAVYQLKAGA